MKLIKIWFIISCILLYGCPHEDVKEDNVMANESEVPLSTEACSEQEVQTPHMGEIEETIESTEAVDITEADVYEAAQEMIEKLDEDFFVKPDEFGKTMYTDDKFEEIKQYEMNIVLDYLGIKHWHRPTSSADEVDLPIDAPLGEYTEEKLWEYTEEKHELIVEYFCGACLPTNSDRRFIALVIKEYEESFIQTIYYQIIDYGYLGKMTGDNSYHYDITGSLDDIKINKIEEGDVNHYVNSWIDEENEEVNVIFDIGKEEREYKYGTHTSYEQSIWVICRKEQDGYKVKEVIPMRLRW